MASLEIPVTPGNASFKLRTDLEGETYELDFAWNSRSLQFQLTIRDAIGSDLISVACVGNYDLLSRFVRQDLPPGNLLILDTTGQQREPTLEGFGTEFILFYQESA